MANFCTNCGAKISKEDNFCMNCGIKIDKSDIKQNNPLFESDRQSMEKEKEIIRDKLKIIDEIFESEDIKSQIRQNRIDQITVISIKDRLKDKIINEKENMIKGEMKYFIKTELEKASKSRITKEMSNKIENNEMTHGGYCSFSCRHCYEEFLDDRGRIVGIFDFEGYVEYYCNLGHYVSFGRYCEDYS